MKMNLRLLIMSYFRSAVVRTVSFPHSVDFITITFLNVFESLRERSCTNKLRGMLKLLDRKLKFGSNWT